jgi:tRNA-specific 2-thiouridylase
MQNKVLVALSGNLMSAVVAALLRHQGFQTVGIFFQIDDSPQKEITEKLSQKLGITLLTMDLREEWKDVVRDHIVHQILSNKIPEPELIGTSELLLKHLLERANEMKCTHVATGHFAKTALDPSTKTARLLRTLESDQSFLLSRLRAQDVSQFILPIGDLSPSAAVKLAGELGLDPSRTTELSSRGFSYIREDHFLKIATQSIPEGLRVPGQMKTQDGTVIGDHAGLFHYRLGQRHGIANLKGKFEHYVVVGTELITQTLILGPESDLEAKTADLKDVHWLRPHDGLRLLKCHARLTTRPDAPTLECIVTPFENGLAQVEFKQRLKMLLPGQSVVFYQEDEVLGGGFVHKFYA